MTSSERHSVSTGTRASTRKEPQGRALEVQRPHLMKFHASSTAGISWIEYELWYAVKRFGFCSACHAGESRNRVMTSHSGLRLPPE